MFDGVKSETDMHFASAHELILKEKYEQSLTFLWL